MSHTEFITENQIDSLEFPDDMEDVAPPPPVVKEPSKSNYYIDNKKLSMALVEWKLAFDAAKEQGLESPRVPEYIGDCIHKIASNMSTKFNFRNYSYRDEMVADANLNALLYLHNFNPKAATRSGLPNGFWYLSQLCHNSFINRIKSEKRQQYYKNRVMLDMLSNMSDLLGEDDLVEMGNISTPDVQAMYADFSSKVTEYEKSESERSKKTKKKDEIAEEEAPKKGGLFAFMEKDK